MATAQQQAEALLNDIDSLGATPAASLTPTNPGALQGNAIEAIEFLDEITKSSPKPKLVAPSLARPSSRATERVSLKTKIPEAPAPPPPTAVEPSIASQSSPWGWGSVWSSASAAIQQAKTVVDEGVKNLPQVTQSDQTRQWREGLIDYVKSAQLDKIGQDLKTVSLSTLTDILNAVAPPIAAHEVIQVWLSHDLEGYDGVETLVYRALTRILEQVEGGDLIVNKGNESRPKDTAAQKDRRELNSVEGFETALKLAKANVDDLIRPASDEAPSKGTSTSTSSIHNPTTYSTVYLRIQPYTSPSPFTSGSPGGASTPSSQQLQFLLHLRDPSHSLESSVVTQALPAGWMHLWDDHEWVEDQLAEVLRLGVEVLGQEYVVARMGWAKGGKDEEEDETFEKVDAHDKPV